MFFSIPNQASSVVTLQPEPWKLDASGLDHSLPKRELTQLSASLSTQHHFISVYEGASPLVRVTKADNPPVLMHGLIADYDAKFPDDPVAHIRGRPASEFLPNWFVETGSSNARLVWLFEQPVAFSNDRHYRAFMKLLARGLGLVKWLAGLDTGALTRYITYYELGKEWLPVEPEARVAKEMLALWYFKAADGVRFDESRSVKYAIPIEDLEEQVNTRFPGRWTGPFQLGARGRRFWDASADNDTAAIVLEEGMLCFTGDQGFVSWRQIFGAAFCEQYESAAISDVMLNTCYDGMDFYVRSSTGNEEWLKMSKPDFTQELRVRGYNSAKAKGQTASEIDRIEAQVKTENRVEGAMPFLFFPRGVIHHKGEKYLNLSRVRPVVPSKVYSGREFHEGANYFPFLHTLIESMFAESEEQRDHFLAWLAYAYRTAHRQEPKPGHTVVIAGPAGVGKTFLSWRVIAGLMGGRADGSSHLVDGDQWTERLVEVPVMTIDDSSALVDAKSRRAFTNKLKRYTANSEMLYNQKYAKTGQVPWFGRIVVTCNLDAESLLILPDMDSSTADKICLFKTMSPPKTLFGTWEENNKRAAEELPLLGRWLLDWVIPEELQADERRFGVKAYHHPDLFSTAREHGIGMLLEMVEGFLGSYFTQFPDKEYWEGTTLQLCADLGDMYHNASREIQYRSMQIQLGKAAAAGYPIQALPVKAGKSIWRIGRELYNMKGLVNE